MRPDVSAPAAGQPIPESVREFLTAYEELLPDVQFPDVDQTFLAALVSDVHDHVVHVEHARARLQAACDALDQARDILVHNARRALAYAKVYAEGDDDVTARLDALALGDVSAASTAAAAAAPARGRSGRAGRPTRRGSSSRGSSGRESSGRESSGRESPGRGSPGRGASGRDAADSRVGGATEAA